MTQLRHHLESAREQYRATTYDGDLAVEVLARKVRPLSIGWIGWSAFAGLAAAITITVVALPDARDQVVQLTRIRWSAQSFNLDLPALPPLPQQPQFAYQKAEEFLHRSVPHVQIVEVRNTITNLIEQLVT